MVPVLKKSVHQRSSIFGGCFNQNLPFLFVTLIDGKSPSKFFGVILQELYYIFYPDFSTFALPQHDHHYPSVHSKGELEHIARAS